MLYSEDNAFIKMALEDIVFESHSNLYTYIYIFNRPSKINITLDITSVLHFIKTIFKEY